MSETMKTRDRSTKKPEDFKAPAAEPVKIEYAGIDYRIDPRAMKNLRVLDCLERNQINSALRVMLGEQDFDRFIDSITDDEGFADIEHAGKLMELVAERTGSKNS